jgi:hypothetical protein
MTVRQRVGPGFRTAVLAIVAAGSVGFAVGDALATPHPNAATITRTADDERSRMHHESRAIADTRAWKTTT